MMPPPNSPDKALPPLYTHAKVVRDGIITGCCVAWVVARSLYGLTLSIIDALFVLSVIATLIYYALWRGRLRRRFRENDGKLCIYCGHSLVGLAETGRCPECGVAFSIADHRAAWIRTELFHRTAG